MKITASVLSIPPYISTSWENIIAVFLKNTNLVILLKEGAQVEIPNLTSETMERIFNAHAQHTDAAKGAALPQTEPFRFSFPMKESGGLLEALNATTQHNPDQAHLPPLPSSVLKKISAIADSFDAGLLSNLPKAEPDCNCIYCQVVKAMQSDSLIEEEVTDEDLKFRSWDVTQTADKLYTVTNPLDDNEHYSVYLGVPIGCTCGQKNCEHVRAVLNT